MTETETQLLTALAAEARGPKRNGLFALWLVARTAEASGRPRVAVLNKVDLVTPKEQLLPLMKTVVEEWGCDEAIPVSALTGEGCDALFDRLQMPLGIGQQQIMGLGDGQAMLDRRQHIMQRQPLGRMIMHIPRGDERNVCLTREADELLQLLPVVNSVMQFGQ